MAVPAAAPPLRRFARRPALAPGLLLRSFHEYYDDIMKYYRLEHKDGQGHSTGWPALDAYYKVGEGGGSRRGMMGGALGRPAGCLAR